MLIGLSLLSHGANGVLLVATRGRGRPTFVDGRDDPSSFLDPLPQAFALTAILITFGVTCFLLALAYRSWVLTRDDAVHDNPEDARARSDPDADTERRHLRYSAIAPAPTPPHGRGGNKGARTLNIWWVHHT